MPSERNFETAIETEHKGEVHKTNEFGCKWMKLG